MRVLMSAGEASGDALGARLIRALKEREANLEIVGMGGPDMVAEGLVAFRRAEELSVSGLVEVIRHLPRLFSLLDDLATKAIAAKPDVAVLIDVPDFNLRLAKKLKRAGIPVVFYVAPTVWAWRRGRLWKFKPWIDRMLVLFPFEEALWREAGVDTVFVGHPLLDALPEPVEPRDGASRTIALLPGSRIGEVKRHMGALLDAARILVDRGLAERFVLPVAPTLDASWLRELISGHPIAEKIELVSAGSPELRYRTVADASVALVASGTATLETALIGRPQVIFYRLSWISYVIIRLLLRVRHIGLPNIIAGREIASELLQHEVTGRALAKHAGTLMADEKAKEEARRSTAELRAKLGAGGCAHRAAEAVLEIARRSR